MEAKKRIEVPFENDYLRSVIKAFNQFLIEEVTGCSYADLRLKNKLEAAQKLYSEERRELCKGNYPRDLNYINTELYFTQSN